MSLWKRKWLVYESSVEFNTVGGLKLSVIRRLDFIAYHFIRWNHGQEKLEEMARKPPKAWVPYVSEEES